MLSLILKENSFQFNGKDYLQTHRTARGTKMAVAFGNIFMASMEKEMLRQSIYKTTTETFQYTNYNSCHPAGVKKGFVKGEALRLLRTNSSKVLFEENIKTLEHAWHREVIPINWWTKSSPKLNSQKEEHSYAKTESAQENSTLCDTISSITAMFEKYSNRKMSLIQNQPLLREIYKELLWSPIGKGKRLKTCLLQQNYKGFYLHNGHTAGVAQVCQPHFNMLVTFLDMTPSCDVWDKQYINICRKEKIFSPHTISRSPIPFVFGVEEKTFTLLKSIYFKEQITNFMLLILMKKPSKETTVSWIEIYSTHTSLVRISRPIEKQVRILDPPSDINTAWIFWTLLISMRYTSSNWRDSTRIETAVLLQLQIHKSSQKMVN